ncbi:MAG TPA: penicillin-binding protein 1B [Gammaproteobacteria bacterium]|nr:penicillin-binding protein 1B [Gammaproteobacteria bacterium]
MARKKSRKTRSRRRRKSRRFHIPWIKLAFAALALLVGYIAFLDFQVYRQFEGKRWSLPARVYARPLELYVGLPLSPSAFADELRALGYRFVSRPRRPGEVARDGGRFELVTRPFRFWDGEEPSRRLQLRFSSVRLEGLHDGARRAVALARLDPLEIGSIHTARQEDRVLLRLSDVPPELVQALIAVEDRDFYRHHGISLRAIGRAMLANLRAGGVVQGGSTLTQQLVKNFFLSSDRSLWRKLNEALMALLLELRYDKDEILEAYINEIYLAQDGQRAIHGFGLGSRYYFQRPVDELDTARIALLVGMVKGPSYYNPRRHPERARERRNLVLRIMREQGIISRAEEQRARTAPLGLVEAAEGTSKTFPAFVDLVRRQLRRDYREDDLTSEGLKIFTTLDPQVQWALQKSLAHRIKAFAGTRPELQGAALVTSASSGEVLALAGGRQAGFAGFNRALDARRQVGSLLKPAVYLTALEQPRRYSLATRIDDGPLEVESGGELWQPENYDHQFHGEVLLYQGLAHSYNVATARLGLELGVGRVIDTLQRLGVETPLRPYPSLFLGAAELSPLEVTQVYQTLASGGFHTPLRAIRAVLDETDQPLQRYQLSVQRVVDPVPALLITRALQLVVAEGTARSLARRFRADTGLAGKTGTTDDLRDSWYAGFDGERLAVVWLGRDDNQPMGLTGAAGALQVWADLFRRTGVSVLTPAVPEAIEWHAIDRETGGLADNGCGDPVQLPFSTASPLPAPVSCSAAPRRWLKRLMR